MSGTVSPGAESSSMSHPHRPELPKQSSAGDDSPRTTRVRGARDRSSSGDATGSVNHSEASTSGATAELSFEYSNESSEARVAQRSVELRSEMHNIKRLAREDVDELGRHVKERLYQNQRYLSILAFSNAQASRQDQDKPCDLRELQAVCKELLEADRVSVFVVDAETSQLEAAVSEDIEGMVLRVGCGIVGKVAEFGKAIRIVDAYHDDRFNPLVDCKTDYRTRSVLCAPVRGRDGSVIAVLQAINKRRDENFDEHDEFYMECFAIQCAVMLDKTVMEQQMVQYRFTMQTIFEVMRTISLHMDVDQSIDAILSATHRLVGADRVSLSLVDYEANELVITSSKDVKGLRIPFGEGFAGHVVRTSELLNIHDAYEDDRFSRDIDRKSGYRTRAILTVPVLDADGVVAAVLQAVNKVEGSGIHEQLGATYFSDDDEFILMGIAGQAALHLKNARLYQEQRAHRRRLSTIESMARAIRSEIKINQVAKNLLAQVKGIISADSIVLFFIDAAQSLVAEFDERSGFGEWQPLGDVGVVASVVKSESILRLRDLHVPHDSAGLAARTGFDPAVDELDQFQTHALLAVPIKGPTEQMISVLKLARGAPLSDPGISQPAGTASRPFTREDEELFDMVAVHSGIALENARSFENKKVQTDYTKELLQLVSPYTVALDKRGCISVCTDKFRPLLPAGSVSKQLHYRTWIDPDSHDRLCEDIARVYEKKQGVTVVEYAFPFSEEGTLVNYKIRPIFETGRRLSIDATDGLSALSAPPSMKILIGVVLCFEFPGEFESVASKLKRSERKIHFLRQELESSKRHLASVFNQSTMIEDCRFRLKSVQDRMVAQMEAKKAAARDSGAADEADINSFRQAYRSVGEVRRLLKRKGAGGDISRSKTLSVQVSQRQSHSIEIGPTVRRRTERRRHSVSSVDAIDSAVREAAELPSPKELGMEGEGNFQDWLSSAFGSGARQSAVEARSKSQAGSRSDSDRTPGSSSRGDSMASTRSATPKLANRKLDVKINRTITAAVMEDIPNWSFDVLSLDLMALPELVLEMFEETDILDTCGVSVDNLVSFITEVGKEYRAVNPFHNFHHGVSVMHYSFLFLIKTHAGLLLNKRLHWYSTLVAALGHDVDHPGLNNTYQINSESPLAMRYNDQSVLENHHCAKTFEIIKRPGCNIMSHFDKDEAKVFRKLVVTAILQTDMVRHYQLICDVKEASVGGAFSANMDEEGGGKIDFDDAVLLTSALVHAADLGNPTRPFKVAKEWAQRLAQEFKVQGEKEIEAGLPVSPLAKSAESELSMAKGEQFFGGKVVLPYWEVLVEIIPKAAPCVVQAKANLVEWKRLADALATQPQVSS